ncbi:MAG: hypothetical protein HQL54_05465 [Magnetococcales bacterium]|nr:hypothetical protein [Magnetococcales bacterium]
MNNHFPQAALREVKWFYLNIGLKRIMQPLAHTLRLNSLAPDIVEATLYGKKPEALTLKVLRKPTPLAYCKQREFYGKNNPLINII